MTREDWETLEMVALFAGLALWFLPQLRRELPWDSRMDRLVPKVIMGIGMTLLVTSAVAALVLKLTNVASAKAAEQANPAMVTCKEGAYICTLSVAVDVPLGVDPNNSILLHDVGYTNRKGSIRVLFFVPDDPPLKPLLDKTYTEDELETQEGAPVNPWHVHRVQIVRAGTPGEVFKERIVLESSEFAGTSADGGHEDVKDPEIP